MLDIGSPLLQLLLNRAKHADFGGRATTIQLQGASLITVVLRWQNNHARRMRQEFTAIQVFDDDSTVVAPEAFSHWLTRPATEPKAAAPNTQQKSRFNADEATVDQRPGTISHLTLQPKTRALVPPGWPSACCANRWLNRRLQASGAVPSRLAD